MSISLESRFWSKVARSDDPDACWPWTAGCFQDGYGAFKFEGRQHKAPRFMYENFVAPIPPNMLVLHHCDNRRCVRPEHLYLGTHADNMRDRAERQRTATGNRNGAHTHPEMRPRGSRQGNSTLTEEDVRAIRAEYRPVYGMLTYLGNKYGVSSSQILRVVQRQSWAHLD